MQRSTKRNQNSDIKETRSNSEKKIVHKTGRYYEKTILHVQSEC